MSGSATTGARTAPPARTEFPVFRPLATRCRYFKPLSFPDALEVGVAIERLGASSITYRLGIFRCGEPDAAAAGRFVHVYVDAMTRQTAAVPDPIRGAANALLLAHRP